ncbi:MAG: hypothetical protein KDK70_32040, partial [Myxococcales bacterium]|nr:hypothetical protein [Myxococcales bacterium]
VTTSTSEPAPEPTAPEPADPERAPASTLAEETQQLEQARAALRRGEALAALAVVDEHLRRFPRGLLVDEARSTRLRALCAAGRHDQAQAFAHALSGGAASSRWHRIVSASCSAP